MKQVGDTPPNCGRLRNLLPDPGYLLSFTAPPHYHFYHTHTINTSTGLESDTDLVLGPRRQVWSHGQTPGPVPPPPGIPYLTDQSDRPHTLRTGRTGPDPPSSPPTPSEVFCPGSGGRGGRGAVRSVGVLVQSRPTHTHALFLGPFLLCLQRDLERIGKRNLGCRIIKPPKPGTLSCTTHT